MISVENMLTLIKKTNVSGKSEDWRQISIAKKKAMKVYHIIIIIMMMINGLAIIQTRRFSF